MTAALAQPGRTVFAVSLDDIHPDPANPRSDLGDLTDLAQSIAEHGVLQPLLATPRRSGGLALVAGHRRLAACRIAGLSVAPVLIVANKLADDRLTLALVENVHHVRLSPMDEARACKALIDFGRSRKDIAFDLARSGNWVADRLALLELPRELQRQVDSGDLSIGAAAQLGHGLRKNGTASTVTDARSPYHFTKRHDLAATATQRCNESGHPVRGRVGPACGRCWETTIRADERGAS